MRYRELSHFATPKIKLERIEKRLCRKKNREIKSPVVRYLYVKNEGATIAIS
ncbi:MAG: hypothetical protein ACI9BD_000243 [Candidatus Marinamargulisbacteria bacterium]|jgi:hypothetical protein